ncbi:MAG: hypothetical protein JW798_04895 [Prolixibacteraceae bacterium]|nr:hypothetical protein [Prolixibacteraceae bacterium]
MKQLFPPEIIEHTTESYFAKYSKGTRVIYVVVLLALLAAWAVTPFIKVDITTQGRGIIRSSQENNALHAAVYAKVQKVFLQENQAVSAGDTLVVLCTNEIDAQNDACRKKILQNQQFINDIEAIIRYEPRLVKTPKYYSEYNEYLARLKQ